MKTQNDLCGTCGRWIALVFLTALSSYAQPPQSPAPVTSPLEAPASFLEVNDETERHVRVPQPVRRIISLAPSLTETVFALGAGDRLVGDTAYCDYPAEALHKHKVGGVINPSIETIVALRPDLVLATKGINRRETVVALEQLGIATYATDPRTVESMLASVARLGELIGASDAGHQLVAGLRERLDNLKRRMATIAPRRVLFVVWLDPLITVGRDTFLADALRRAGAESVIQSSQDWPQINLEEIVRLQPEYLVFANSRAESSLRDFQALAEFPGWRNLEAVQNNRVAIISDAVDRPSPRLVDAIEQLARQLHPEVFRENKGEKKDKFETPPSAQRSDKRLQEDLPVIPRSAFSGSGPAFGNGSSCAR
jgi:iron complex transport system substrate-binding protein